MICPAARCAAIAALAAGLQPAPPAAQAEIVDIAWQDGNRFDRSLTVAPGKLAELCGALAAGARVAWAFESDADLNFNIHYHLGKAVHYPARQGRVRQSTGDLAGNPFETQHRIRDIKIAMRRCPQPVIAICQGAASGGGFTLALASDVRLVTPDARMNAAFIKMGLTGCDMGSSYFLPRLVGSSVASDSQSCC